MINSRKLQITGLSMLSLVGSGCTDKNGSIENGVRPNIVLFLADDIGAECFGCMGGVSYDTHIIDSLAEKSLFFPNMHAQPLSSPSRVQLMTGLYNDKNYVCFGYMNDDEPTFSQLAQQAGYTTGMFGKWHVRCRPGWGGTSGVCFNLKYIKNSMVRLVQIVMPIV